MQAVKKPVLYVLIGVSGSGKSTFVNSVLNSNSIMTVSTDDIREELLGDASIQTCGAEVFKTAYYRTRLRLIQGYDVVFDATNTTTKSRKRLLDNVADIQCEKIAVFVNTPLKDAKERNAKRRRNVPDKVIDHQFEQLMNDASTIPDQFDKIIIVGEWKYGI